MSKRPPRTSSLESEASMGTVRTPTRSGILMRAGGCPERSESVFAARFLAGGGWAMDSLLSKSNSAGRARRRGRSRSPPATAKAGVV